MTAVEYLINELSDIIGPIEATVSGELLMAGAIKRAKEMEKEQHQETWDSAHQAGRFEGKGIAEENWQTFETYWLETFKSK